MAPENLKDLARAKSVLRLRITCRRIRCADAAVRLGRSLAWWDRARTAYRQLAPLLGLACTLWRPRARNGGSRPRSAQRKPRNAGRVFPEANSL